MTWFLAYNHTANPVPVDDDGRVVPPREFTYADYDDPVTAVAVTAGTLIDVPMLFDPATVDPSAVDPEALTAAAQVIYRNGGTWTPPPAPAPAMDLAGLVDAVTALQSARNAPGGVAGLDANGRVPDTRLPVAYTRDVAGGVAGLDGDGRVPAARLPRVLEMARTAQDATARTIYRLTGALESTVKNTMENYVTMRGGVPVESFLASCLNEWGALRGTSPYSWGDALVRGIREDGDGVTSGLFVHLADRRTGASHQNLYGRRWADGSLVRNGISMADVYVTTSHELDTNIVNLPSGTLVVEVIP